MERELIEFVHLLVGHLHFCEIPIWIQMFSKYNTKRVVHIRIRIEIFTQISWEDLGSARVRTHAATQKLLSMILDYISPFVPPHKWMTRPPCTARNVKLIWWSLSPRVSLKLTVFPLSNYFSVSCDGSLFWLVRNLEQRTAIFGWWRVFFHQISIPNYEMCLQSIYRVSIFLSIVLEEQ